VWLAALVAVVLGLRPVVDLAPPLVTAGAAAAQLGVEGVEQLAVDLAQRQQAEDWANVQLEIGAFVTPRHGECLAGRRDDAVPVRHRRLSAQAESIDFPSDWRRHHFEMERLP